MKNVKISEAEWQVMNVVWRRSPVAAAQVVEALAPGTAWRPRTVRTLLDRLVKKGALKITAEGKRYFYEPILTLQTCMLRESRSFMDRVFGGEPAPMLLHLVKETKLSKEEIEQLKKLLGEKEP